MSQEPHLPNFGLDPGFFSRVYKTSLVLIVIGALLIWERYKTPAALGWIVGSGMSLGGLAMVDWAVRRFLTAESPAMGPLIGTSMAKIIGAAVVLAGIFAAAMRGWIGLIWVLAGFALPHTVVFLKLIGRAVVAANKNPSGGLGG
jgi:hypothetical protein